MRFNHETEVLARCKKGEIVLFSGLHWQVGGRANHGKLVQLQRNERRNGKPFARKQTLMGNTRVGRIVSGRVLA